MVHILFNIYFDIDIGPANRYQFMVSKAGYTCQGIARYKHTYCMLSYGVILRSLALQLLLLSTVEKLHESTWAVAAAAATTPSIHSFIHSTTRKHLSTDAKFFAKLAKCSWSLCVYWCTLFCFLSRSNPPYSIAVCRLAKEPGTTKYIGE